MDGAPGFSAGPWTSTRLQPIRERLRSLAADHSPVLLVGEEGTERADLARYLHAESPQRSEGIAKPFEQREIKPKLIPPYTTGLAIF